MQNNSGKLNFDFDQYEKVSGNKQTTKKLLTVGKNKNFCPEYLQTWQKFADISQIRILQILSIVLNHRKMLGKHQIETCRGKLLIVTLKFCNDPAVQVPQPFLHLHDNKIWEKSSYWQQHDCWRLSKIHSRLNKCLNQNGVKQKKQN